MKPVRERSLLPREHGAYGQLGFPIVAALALSHDRGVAAATAAAAVCAFLMHEPFLIVCGRRGTRAAREQKNQAMFMLAGLAALGLVFIILSLAYSPPGLALALAAPLLLGGLVALFVVLGNERTALGETVAATAMASVTVPVMVAGGRALDVATWVWLVWIVATTVVILPIRALVTKQDAKRARGVAATVTAMVFAVFLTVAATRASLGITFAVIPACAFALFLCAWPPPRRRMKTVGWTAMAVSVLTLAALLLGAGATLG